jgi:hypothetical protein
MNFGNGNAEAEFVAATVACLMDRRQEVECGSDPMWLLGYNYTRVVPTERPCWEVDTLM